MVAPRGEHAWLLWGCVRGCSIGACMVARGCVWLLLGGACMIAPRGCVWLLLGGRCVVAPGVACVVAPGRGGMHGCSGGACVVAARGAWLLPGGGACDTTRYGDTINERAVRILLECILVDLYH